MRVYEVAREFKIDPEKLTQLLRSMGVAVRSEATAVDDATVAILRARFERERRASSPLPVTRPGSGGPATPRPRAGSGCGR